MKHDIIYVPGILDNVYHIQGAAVRTWRLYGVSGHLHVMPWAGEESYEVKLQRLLDEIDEYVARGHRVSLVGASAGASAVLNAYLERRDRIHRLAYICAKINGPETVGKKLYAENPAFKTSLAALQKNLPKLTTKDKNKMLSLYSPKDGTVPYEATVITGVRERELPALRHGQAIIYSLSIGARNHLISFLNEES